MFSLERLIQCIELMTLCYWIKLICQTLISVEMPFRCHVITYLLIKIKSFINHFSLLKGTSPHAASS